MWAFPTTEFALTFARDEALVRYSGRRDNWEWQPIIDGASLFRETVQICHRHQRSIAILLLSNASMERGKIFDWNIGNGVCWKLTITSRLVATVLNQIHLHFSWLNQLAWSSLKIRKLKMKKGKSIKKCGVPTTVGPPHPQMAANRSLYEAVWISSHNMSPFRLCTEM